MYTVIVSDLQTVYEQTEELESTSPEDAILMYKEILKRAHESKEMFILSKIGHKLRKLGLSKLFIDTLKDYSYENEIKKNYYLNNAYLYCLYSIEISSYDNNDEKFNVFLENAEFITDNCEQLDSEKCYYNPYVLTVYKVVHVLKSRASANYNLELKWIDKLNPELLPVDAKEIKSSDGKTHETASYKEFYYQTKTKCLEKIEEFEKCIELCDEALSIFEKFHYRNDLWISARKYYCKCLQSSCDNEDIENYKSLAENNNFWYMYHKLSNIYFSQGIINKALYYSCKALLCDNFDHEKMIKLIYDIGLLFENCKKNSTAKIFYEAVLYYRNQAGWFIPEELRFAKETYKLNDDLKPNINLLLKSAFEIVKDNDKLKYGIISRYDYHRKFGFIESNNQSIYFSLNRIKIRLKLRDAVYFKIKEENGKTYACDIYKIGGNYGKNFN